MASACGVAVLAAMIASATASKNIFIAGDSMGEYSAQVLESFCKGATVYNGAVGGTTAVQWTGSGDMQDSLGSQKCGGKPDYIWLTVGGNDVLNTGCGDTETKESITAKVTATINSVKAKAPGVKILITGYCMPNSAEARRLFGNEKMQAGNRSTPRRLACSSPAKFTFIGDAVKAAADDDAMVTYVDSTEACGGSKEKWSDKRYFADAIHLNNQGFCKVFSQTKVQEFFGCEAATYACETLTCAITGYKHCSGEGDMSECASCSENCIVSKGSGTTGSAATSQGSGTTGSAATSQGSGTTGSAPTSTIGTTGSATTATTGSGVASLSQTNTIQCLTVAIVASSLLGYWW